MTDSFGARLRRRREQQQIDLIAIAAQTKIKVSLLESLERDDVSHWPSGIFRRAYMRAYAQAIGLDPDIVVREFLKVHPDTEETVTTEALASALNGSGVNGAPPTRLRYLVGSAIDSLARLRRSQPAGDGRIVTSVATPPPRVLDAPAVTQLPDFSWIEPNAAAAAERMDHAVQNEQVSAADHADLGAGDVPPAAAAEVDDVSVAAARDPIAEDAVHGEKDIPPADSAPREAMPARNDADVLASDDAAATNLDLVAFARLCTAFGRVGNPDEIQALLQEALAILDAPGLIVWIWDAPAEGLRAALAAGYSERVLAQLPVVKFDADNATAAAFRSGEARIIAGRGEMNGALALPLLTTAGAAGVLALELQHESEQKPSVRALATIMAAMLAQLVGYSATVQEPEVVVTTVTEIPAPVYALRHG